MAQKVAFPYRTDAGKVGTHCLNLLIGIATHPSTGSGDAGIQEGNHCEKVK